MLSFITYSINVWGLYMKDCIRTNSLSPKYIWFHVWERSQSPLDYCAARFWNDFVMTNCLCFMYQNICGQEMRNEVQTKVCPVIIIRMFQWHFIYHYSMVNNEKYLFTLFNVHIRIEFTVFYFLFQRADNVCIYLI